jgi:hypothetical protein
MLQILLCAMSGSSWQWTQWSKDIILHPQKNFNRMWQQMSQPCQRRSSRGDSSNGMTVGASVYICRRAVLWRWLCQVSHISFLLQTLSEFCEISDLLHTWSLLSNTNLHFTITSEPAVNRANQQCGWKCDTSKLTCTKRICKQVGSDGLTE